MLILNDKKNIYMLNLDMFQKWNTIEKHLGKTEKILDKEYLKNKKSIQCILEIPKNKKVFTWLLEELNIDSNYSCYDTTLVSNIITEAKAWNAEITATQNSYLAKIERLIDQNVNFLVQWLSRWKLYSKNKIETVKKKGEKIEYTNRKEYFLDDIETLLKQPIWEDILSWILRLIIKNLWSFKNKSDLLEDLFRKVINHVNMWERWLDMFLKTKTIKVWQWEDKEYIKSNWDDLDLNFLKKIIIKESNISKKTLSWIIDFHYVELWKSIITSPSFDNDMINIFLSKTLESNDTSLKLSIRHIIADEILLKTDLDENILIKIAEIYDMDNIIQKQILVHPNSTEKVRSLLHVH